MQVREKQRIHVGGSNFHLGKADRPAPASVEQQLSGSRFHQDPGAEAFQQGLRISRP
jgi:hypothetical protein